MNHGIKMIDTASAEKEKESFLRSQDQANTSMKYPSPSSSQIDEDTKVQNQQLEEERDMELSKDTIDELHYMEEQTESLLHTIDDVAPVQIKPYVHAVIPWTIWCITMMEKSIPYLYKAYCYLRILMRRLEPYKLDLLLPGFLGLVMCFFGGSYMTVIAACEAYRIIGLEAQLKFVRDLRIDFTEFTKANAEDDQRDDDHDGIMDVKQLSKTQLAERKALLFLKTVDPNRISEAFFGLSSGLFAVIATLKMQFCKAITLAVAIGDVMMGPCNKFLTPALEMAIPSDYKKWAHSVVVCSIKGIALSVAWFVYRIISAFHSAIRGGHMFTTNIFEYLHKFGWSIKPNSIRWVDEALAYVVAACGLYFQLSMGFTVPFPLNIILFPFTLAEWFLMWIVNSRQGG